MKLKLSKLNFNKLNGLVPAIVQDNNTLQILMVGFMNNEAYKKTVETKKVWFYSRTKKRLWMKGETSKNCLNVINIKSDCDNDSLLILTKPDGPTCHTGKTSCFGKTRFTLQNLFKLIEQRKKDMPNSSYTTSLFQNGQKKILEKIKEESKEVIRAARSEGKQRVIEESCDLIYHLFVLLANQDIKYMEIINEFSKRRK